MTNVRLYIRSIQRTVIKQKEIFTQFLDLFKETIQIHQKKIQLQNKVLLNKEKFQRKSRIVNSGNANNPFDSKDSIVTSSKFGNNSGKAINFVR